MSFGGAASQTRCATQRSVREMDFLKKGGDFFAGLEADLNAGIKDEAPPAVTAAAAPAAADAAVDDAADVAVDGAPAAAGGDDALRQRLVASQQQCRKLEQRLAEKAELCAEKDAQIAAVLEEGEQLSKRQLDQEKTIRALRQSLREAQTATELAEAEVESLREGHEASERQRSEALAERTKQAAAVEGELGKRAEVLLWASEGRRATRRGVRTHRDN